MARRPNFLVIVADDLGWSDTSPFGGEIRTPNIQRLADEGLIFTDFHTASACSPTRSMLLTGTDNHIVGLGQMAETAERFPDLFDGKNGYEGYLNDKVAALPEILTDNGYKTFMSGKWHLGLTKDRFPAARGFQESFALLPGAGNHYAYEPQSEDGNPVIPFLPPLYARNDNFLDHQTLTDFYSSSAFARELVDMLKKNEDSISPEPFFAYLPFTAPHWPLQAPRAVIQSYYGVYDDGPDALREKRLKRQIELGILQRNHTVAPVKTEEKDWNDLSPDERARSARSMEIYAAMVETMDKSIGSVLDYLENIGQLDNTFIIFMSDNGAEGSILEAIPVLSSNPPVKYFDNSLKNMGNKDSFIWYGPRWAQAATAPSKLTKGFISEGGIRCPAVLRYPPMIGNNRISTAFTTVMDVLPTVLELADIAPVGSIFRGNTVMIPRGKSWVTHLKTALSVYSDADFIGWELFAQRAIRRGHWKAVYIPREDGNNEWELYDLTKDKGETTDLAKDRPDILQYLLSDWLKYEAETGLVAIPDEVAYEMRIFAGNKVEKK